MSESEWWEPDIHTVDAVKAGRLGLKDLDVSERSWVVASLSESGYSVTNIAAWLKCSTRQIKRIRAAVLTQQMRLVIRERQRTEHIERSRQEAIAQNQRLGEELLALNSPSVGVHICSI